MLMHHADPESDRILWAGDGLGPILDENLAGVCGVEAVRDAHRGRLPGPVFADDGVDGAGLNLDGDVIVRHDGAEFFRDVPQFDHWNIASVTFISPAMIFFLAASAALIASGEIRSLLYSSSAYPTPSLSSPNTCSPGTNCLFTTSRVI